MSRVFCLAAHPDDEVLGPGGTLAMHAINGDEVGVVILGEGPTSRDTKPIESARASAERAAEILGISWLECLGWPDQRFDTLPLLDCIKSVEKIRDEHPPDIVYCHWSGDLNQDHRIASQIALTAFRPMPGSCWRRLLQFHTASSTDWAGPETCFKPNVFADIEKTMHIKEQALSAYEQELREYPHQRSHRSVMHLAAYFGNRAGLSAAEAFVLVRDLVF